MIQGNLKNRKSFREKEEKEEYEDQIAEEVRKGMQETKEEIKRVEEEEKHITTAST